MVGREITKVVHVRVRGKRMVWRTGEHHQNRKCDQRRASLPCGGAVLDVQMNYG